MSTKVSAEKFLLRNNLKKEGELSEEHRKCTCRCSEGGESLAWPRGSEEGQMAGVEGKRDREEGLRVEGG